MVFDNPKEYRLTSEDVQREIRELDYRLPLAEVFQTQMKTQKIAAVPVAAAPQAEFICSDRYAFFKYLRANGIRGVMYSYLYYTAADIDRCYDLQDADKAFFRKRRRSNLYRDFPRSRYGMRAITENSSRIPAPCDTDYDSYLLYCKFLRLTLDLSYPKQMDIFALQGRRVLCCRLEDLWLERLALPNAAMIKSQCLNTGTVRDEDSEGDGQIAFQFDYIVKDPTHRSYMPQGNVPEPPVSPLQESPDERGGLT